MKRYRFFNVCILVCSVITLSFCNKPQKEDTTQSELTGELSRLQVFLDIPIYPNSELANITTPLSDDKIPSEPMQAQVTLTIDDYEKVPPFYETQLGQKFTADVDGDKKYYL